VPFRPSSAHRATIPIVPARHARTRRSPIVDVTLVRQRQVPPQKLFDLRSLLYNDASLPPQLGELLTHV